MENMNRKLQILLIAGIVLTALAANINIYAGGIVFILCIAAIMSFMIMQDSTSLPEIGAELTEDAKALIIRNTGNAPAVKIHIALVPENIEFDIPVLAVEESFRYTFDRMISEIKIVISYENEAGNTFSRSSRLSSLGETFEPLKPMIPLFRWK